MKKAGEIALLLNTERVSDIALPRMPPAEQWQKLLDAAAPFWAHPEFWIHGILGLGGLVFAILAFVEAKQARRAATEAGRIVKMQTVAIELTELSQRLDRLDPEIEFSDARDFLNELSRKIRRLVSPFEEDDDLSETIGSLREALVGAKQSLSGVRPAPNAQAPPPPGSVYFAIEGDLVTINGFVADLLGQLEAKSVDSATHG